LFFQEIDRKDAKSLGSLLPEIIRRLSEPQISAAVFKNFVEHVLAQTELSRKSLPPLLEKLLQRMQLAETQQEQRNISLTLAIFNYEDPKTLKILNESFPSFRHCLEDREILANFLEILKKSRFQGKTQERRQHFSELERLILDRDKDKEK